MRVAVLTPYHKESLDVLKRCHDSVVNQTHADVVHFMVADGHAIDEIDTWEKIEHIKLPNQHADYGDTPRCIGALSISAQGFDAITLLDADNWFEPNHIETLLKMQRDTGAQVVTGTRTLRRPDESILAVDTESDGVHFNDTNCYLMMKPTFVAFSSWGFKDTKEGIIGDRYFWETVQRMGYTRAHCTIPTTNYVTTFAYHYEKHGETPPDWSKVIARLPGDTHNTMYNYVDYVAKIKAIRAKA
jgi:glycosyltransferase involved in cell wall biosynthesis